MLEAHVIQRPVVARFIGRNERLLLDENLSYGRGLGLIRRDAESLPAPGAARHSEARLQNRLLNDYAKSAHARRETTLCRWTSRREGN